MIEVKARLLTHPHNHWLYLCPCGIEHEAIPTKSPPGSCLYSPRKLNCGCRVSLVPDMTQPKTRMVLNHRRPAKPKPKPTAKKRRKPRDRQIKTLQRRCRELEQSIEAMQEDITFILIAGDGRWW